MSLLARQIVYVTVAGVPFVGSIEVDEGDVLIRVPLPVAALAGRLARRIEASGAIVSEGKMTTAEYEEDPVTPTSGSVLLTALGSLRDEATKP